MAERILEADAVEEAVEQTPGTPDPEVRALPTRRSSAELESWRGEVRAIAVVAAGGLAVGVATVAAVSAARSRSHGRGRNSTRRSRPGRDGIVASRSFLVDVHVLGR